MEGYSMQETGVIPYNPYDSSSPYNAFMVAGYNPDNTDWQTQYEQQGMDAFTGTGIEGYDSEADFNSYNQDMNNIGEGSSNTASFGNYTDAPAPSFNQPTGGTMSVGYEPWQTTGIERPDASYNPDSDYNDWMAQNPDTQTPETPPTTPSTGFENPPMPPWMNNLATGKSFAPWSLIYDNPTPFASKEQWNNMNPSEQKGMIGSLPQYQQEDFLHNMQKAFVPGVDRNSATSYIV